MKSIVRLAVLLAAGGTVGSSALRAQSPQCPAGVSAIDPKRITQDACQQALDLFQYMAPQLGTAIAGGNATLGQGGSLGGLGHFVVGLRVNAVAGSVPQISQVVPSTTGATSREFQTKDTPIPMPIADAAIGVFKGLPLGLTNVGGVDLIVNASYIPKLTEDNVTVDPSNPLKLGYGVRERAPGVAAHARRFDHVPQARFAGDDAVRGIGD